MMMSNHDIRDGAARDWHWELACSTVSNFLEFFKNKIEVFLGWRNNPKNCSLLQFERASDFLYSIKNIHNKKD